MRIARLAAATTLMLLAASGPTFADSLSPYIALSGGLANLFDTDFDSGGATGHINYSAGWLAAIAVGGRLTPYVRVEFELSNQAVSLKNELINGLGTIDLDGDVQVVTGLVKVDYDFELGRTQPFVGVGVGLAGFGVELDSPIQFDDNDLVLAGAVEAGITIPISENIEAFGRAQLMLLDDVTLSPPGGDAMLEHPTLLSASVGLRVGF